MAVQKGRVSFPYQDTTELKPSELGLSTELVYQRAQSNGKKIEFHVERLEGTRFHTLSVQRACFKAGRKKCPQLKCKQIKCIEAKLT